MAAPKIIPLEAEHVAAVVEFTAATAMFYPHEVVTLEGLLGDYLASYRDFGHRAFVLIDRAEVTGFVYHAPDEMADRTWKLYWIVVSPNSQGKGAGGELLRFVEGDIAAREGRVLFVETSGLERYAPTCRFYRKHGYDAEARLRDYYAEGDDQIVFRKRIKATNSD